MEFDEEKMRQTMSLEYAPTRRSPSSSPSHRFLQKDFETLDIAELFHENTKFTEQELFRLSESLEFFETDAMKFALANVRPDYDRTELVELPEPDELDARLTEVLSNRRSRRRYASIGVTASQLSTLLGHACGTNGEWSLLPDEPAARKPLRTYPSAGGLYPVEVYVAVPKATESLDTGLYYYVPEEHGLRKLDEDDEDVTSAIDATLNDDGVAEQLSALVFLTGSFWRSKMKYGPRGYRFALQESGHVCQNLLLVAEAMGLGVVPISSYRDAAVDDFLGVDGVDESVIYGIAVGVRQGDRP